MIHGISEYEKYKILRPIIGGCEKDQYGIPIMKKVPVDSVDWEVLRATGLQNASPKYDNRRTILLMFNYDDRLLSLWNNPLKKIGLFQSYAAVGTPDYSLSPFMNINDLRHNVYKSRWLGCTWQNYGCNAVPTVGWALPDTYDLCFSSIPFQSVVIISTVGCQGNEDVFLAGFKEMKRRIDPPLIVVYGDVIAGMTGTFVNYRYVDTFDLKYEQLKMKEISPIYTIKEDKSHGI